MASIGIAIISIKTDRSKFPITIDTLGQTGPDGISVDWKHPKLYYDLVARFFEKPLTNIEDYAYSTCAI